MAVDFKIKKFSGCRVATITYVGPYRGSDMMRAEFNQLMKWAKGKKLWTGRWFFIERDGPDVPDRKRRWQAGIEIKEKFRSGGKVRFKELPQETVASITFDPEKVAARVIYHGLEGWLQWRKKYGEYKQAGPTREVYLGDPWTSKRAWANVEVQVPLKKL